MKQALIIASLFVGSMVMAQGGTPAPAAPAAPAAAAPAATKVSKKEAKMECKKDNPAIKGKELKACIESKIK